MPIIEQQQFPKPQFEPQKQNKSTQQPCLLTPKKHTSNSNSSRPKRKAITVRRIKCIGCVCHSYNEQLGPEPCLHSQIHSEIYSHSYGSKCNKSLKSTADKLLVSEFWTSKERYAAENGPSFRWQDCREAQPFITSHPYVPSRWTQEKKMDS